MYAVPIRDAIEVSFLIRSLQRFTQLRRWLIGGMVRLDWTNVKEPTIQLLPRRGRNARVLFRTQTCTRRPLPGIHHNLVDLNFDKSFRGCRKGNVRAHALEGRVNPDCLFFFNTQLTERI
jgi:hypothetical protein